MSSDQVIAGEKGNTAPSLLTVNFLKCFFLFCEYFLAGERFKRNGK